MKIRTDFITNSSSSSFILAFENDEAYNKFKTECYENDYIEVYKLINNFKKKSEKDKLTFEELENCLKRWIVFDESIDYINDKMPHGLDFSQRVEMEEKIKETEDYKKHMENYLKSKQYNQKCEKIKKAKHVVMGTIWDNQGGLLEFAIREGILKKYPLNQWLIYQMDIG